MFPSPAQRTFGETVTWRLLAALPLLVVGGIGVLIYAQGQGLDPIFWVFVAFCAVPFLYACVWAAKRRLTIHAEGLSYKSLFNETDLQWDQITETRYGQQPVNMYAHFGLIGLLLSLRKGQNVQRSLQVIGPRIIKISPQIRDNPEAIRLVLERVNPRMRQEAERLLGTGATVPFGNVALSPVGVIWKGKEPIPYSAIVKCRIDGAFLRIKAEGKWLDNVAVRAKNVPNIFVLLDLVEQRRSALSQMTAAAIAGSSSSQYL
jgi:hypothetical protein